MRLIKYIPAIFVFTFSMFVIPFNAKADTTITFDYTSSSYPSDMTKTENYNKLIEVLEKFNEDIDYMIQRNYQSTGTFRQKEYYNIAIFHKGTMKNLTLLRASTNLFTFNNMSGKAIMYKTISLDSSSNSFSSFYKDLEETTIPSFLKGQATSRYYVLGDGAELPYLNLSTYYPFIPLYISDERINIDLNGDTYFLKVIYPEASIDSDITVHDLFYYNHYQEKMIYDEISGSDVDLSNIEKLLYGILFILFAFFIYFVFRFAWRFIKVILPI